MEAAEIAFSEDLFLNGRLLLRQPVKGHRLGTDAILLQAATPAHGRVADLGSGAGLVGLALALRGAKEVVLVERDPVFAACAMQNAVRAGFSSVSVSKADIFHRADFLADMRLADQSFDAVATNPPYDQSLRSRRTPHPLKRVAHAMDGGGLGEWLAASLRLLKDGGTLTLVHRADCLGSVLAALPRRAGGIRIRPVQPRAGQPAQRILVRATAGSRARLSLLAPLVLMGDDGQYTDEAALLHAGEANIDFAVA